VTGVGWLARAICGKVVAPASEGAL